MPPFIRLQSGCRIHAASVLQVTHLLIHNGLIQQGILDGITMLACYISGMIVLPRILRPGMLLNLLL